MAINAAQRMTSIVFIDGSLADLQAILAGLDPSVTAVVLDPAQPNSRKTHSRNIKPKSPL